MDTKVNVQQDIQKKHWQKPELTVMDSQKVESGGQAGGAEGQLTPVAIIDGPPFTAASYYHS